ncbi:MAG: glycosyltransferase, partial [Pyrinomonadaceae bacterium]|nr:glycosyltransferase [Pyrinomonadaceae bacterium]
KRENSISVKNIPVSIVIAVRNEEEHIVNLLKSISVQAYDLSLVEVIIVNDHSCDSTKDSVLQFQSMSSLHVSLIDLPENLTGKKAAIHLAIENAQNNLIITYGKIINMLGQKFERLYGLLNGTHGDKQYDSLFRDPQNQRNY